MEEEAEEIMDTELMRSLLEQWIEIHDEPCRYDHHGYCQSHFLEDMGDCIVERSMKAIS